LPDSYLYEVSSIQQLAGHVSQIFLRAITLPPLSYAAGQYVNVMHHNQSASPLSIACAPHVDGVLEFHLFHPPENHQAEDLMRLAQNEKKWRITGPFGTCTAACLDLNMPVIFIARGTGFAPIKAVIEDLAWSWHYPPLHFYWSMPDLDHFYLMDLLEKWSAELPGFSFTPVFQDRDSEKPDSLLEILLRGHLDFSTYQVYSSGSPRFVSAVCSEMRAHGLQKEFFYSDVYG